MSIEDCSLDRSTLSRFRTALTKTKTFNKLFTSINRQLVAHNIIIKTGLIVDMSLVDTPLRTKEKTNHEITVDRSEVEVTTTIKYADSVDKQATWLKKRGKYDNHRATIALIHLFFFSFNKYNYICVRK